MAPTRPLAWEFPYAMGTALEKKKKRKKKEMVRTNLHALLLIPEGKDFQFLSVNDDAIAVDFLCPLLMLR